MDWTVYWFMFPGCIMIAAIATFSGISGAALLTPIFLIAFPLLKIPGFTTVEAIGIALFLETAGFGTGVYRYVSMRLADLHTARSLIAVCLPLGTVGAVLAHHVPAEALRIGYGVAMLGVAWLLYLEYRKHSAQQGDGLDGKAAAPFAGHEKCPSGQRREMRAVGRTYHYCAHGLALQHVFSGVGAFLAGLISTGVGEATLPPLVRRSRFPAAVAAATSTLVVAGTVVGASVTHLVQLALAPDAGIKWNLIVWAVPGAIIGAHLGTRFHGRISERTSHLIFAVLFLGIGLTFLIAFTVFAHHFVAPR